MFCSQEGGNITEITNDKKQTFICDFAGYFPNYRLVYPNLSKDGFIKIQKSELKAVAGFVKEIAKRNKKSGFSLRTIAGENKVYLSYNDADSNGHKELCVTLEKAALIDIKLGSLHQTLSLCFPAGLVAYGWWHLIGRRSSMIRRHV